MLFYYYFSNKLRENLYLILKMLKNFYFILFILSFISKTFAMEDQLIIRESKVEDAFEVEKLRINSWKKSYSGIIDSDFLDSLNPQESFQARSNAILSKRDSNLVVIVNGKIVGVSDAGQKRAELENPKAGEIYSLYVDEQYQRQGIGYLLFQKQCENLSQKGYKEISIWVLKDNNLARSFYSKYGGILGEEKYFKIGNKQYLQVVYQWHL